MPARPPRSKTASLDRPLRALARGEPDAVLALLRLAAPGLLPPRARVVPEDVDDPSIDVGSVGGAADMVARVGDDIALHVEFQGYRDHLFGRRVVFYNAGLLKRYPRRRVISVAIWTVRPPSTASPNEIRVCSVILGVTGIVLPDLPAETLLRDARTACFAVGADLGGKSIEWVCQRVVEVMAEGQASEAAWRVAQVVAVATGRYKEFQDAMEQARIKPPLTDDLVRYGIDVGYRKGRRRGRVQGQAEGREQGRVEGRLEGQLEGRLEGRRQGHLEGRRQGRVEGRRKGLTLGLRRALLTTYAARFGDAPPEVAAAVDAMRDPETLLAWQALFSTQTAAAIAATLLGRRRRG